MDHNHLLWDDTVAGPKPERIPGKNIMFQHLNNHNNNYGGSGSGFSTCPSILSARSAPPLTVNLPVLDPVDVVVPVVTRRITILKPNSSSNYYGSGSGSGSGIGNVSGGHEYSSSILTCTSSSVPSSPVDSSSSLSSSPFSPRTPQFDSKGLLTRRKNPNPNPNPMTTTTTTKKKLVHEPRTPTVYDWVVISAMDR